MLLAACTSFTDLAAPVKLPDELTFWRSELRRSLPFLAGSAFVRPFFWGACTAQKLALALRPGAQVLTRRWLAAFAASGVPESVLQDASFADVRTSLK